MEAAGRAENEIRSDVPHVGVGRPGDSVELSNELSAGRSNAWRWRVLLLINPICYCRRAYWQFGPVNTFEVIQIFKN